MELPKPLSKLIYLLKRLPGVGAKSAERFAFHLLNWPEENLTDLGEIIRDIKNKIEFCQECGALKQTDSCTLCSLTRQEAKTICIVATFKDVYLFEQTKEYQGLYHVLGGLLSPLQGRLLSQERIQHLLNRIKKFEISEVIIALEPTLEGDATALVLKEQLNSLGLKCTRLALGLPMGSSLDFVDGGTLARALSGRNSY